jgi:hypothetical protein
MTSLRPRAEFIVTASLVASERRLVGSAGRWFYACRSITMDAGVGTAHDALGSPWIGRLEDTW